MKQAVKNALERLSVEVREEIEARGATNILGPKCIDGCGKNSVVEAHYGWVCPHCLKPYPGDFFQQWDGSRWAWFYERMRNPKWT